MNRKWIALAVLAFLCLGFIGLVAGSTGALPEKVASHFDISGRADGWMARSNYLLFIGFMGIGIALFTAGLCYVTRFFPDWMINLPHKEYWMAPDRREETNDFLLTHGIWLSCLILAHFSGLHVLTIAANQRQPPSMPDTALWSVTAGFLVLLTVWILTLLRRFRKKA